MKKYLFLILSVLLLAGVSANVAAKPKTETNTVTYNVNMHCQNCVNRISDNLSFIDGVKDIKVSLKNKTVTIKFDPAKVDEARFVENIEKLGYTAEKVVPKEQLKLVH